MTVNTFKYLTPLESEISKCIKCGICMSGCPTFAVTKDETQVARGRLALVSAALDGRIESSGKYSESITSCIGCMTCDLNCPVGIRITDIIFAARAQIAETRGMSIIAKFASRWVVGLRWPLPILFRSFIILEKIYHWLPVKGPLVNLIPFVKHNIKRQLPSAGGRSLTSQYPVLIRTKVRNPGGMVAFFPGCVIDLSTQDIGRATISVLNKLGYDVMIPEGQNCCGSPVQSLGDVKTAQKMALKNVEIFSSIDIQDIIVSCATCAHTLKKVYPILLSALPNGDFRKVKDFSERIIDIHEFILTRHPDIKHINNGDMIESRTSGDQFRVTYHDPCHLKKGMGIFQSPRQLIRSIPAAEFVEMEEADACCGFGGIFSLYHYDLASEIGKKKAENIRRTGSEVVATGCPGCKIHIEDSLNRAGYHAKVRHTVELLDEFL